MNLGSTIEHVLQIVAENMELFKENYDIQSIQLGKFANEYS